MALFGRRKKDIRDDELLDLDEVEDEVQRPEPVDGEPGVDRDWTRAQDGPYDLSEWPALDGRIDLGALRLPNVRGMQLRLDLEKGSGRVIGATIGFGASQAQVQVFAAPRTAGLWDELRPDIASGLVDAGGAAEAVDGMMGKELRARMPGRAPDGRVAFQPARFVGVDGPRWFLRVVINGPAATDDNQVRGILAYVRRIVVSRGDEARPPREVLTLTPPRGFAEAMEKEAQARKAQAAAAKQAAAKEALRKAPSAASSSDATAVSGISAQRTAQPPTTQTAQAQPAAAEQAADETGVVAETDGAEPGAAEPDRTKTDAPKAPNNPDFT